MDLDRSDEPRLTLGFDHYVRSISRNWWLIGLVAVVFAGVAGLLASRTQTEYRSRASIALAPAPTLEDSGQQLEALLSMRTELRATLSKLVTSGVVLDAAGDGAYRDEMERGELALAAYEIPESLVVEINVTGDDPEVVAGFIEAVVAASVEQFEGLYEVSLAEPLDPAPSVGPTRLSVKRRVAVAGTVGLGAGFLLALARDALGRTRWSKRNHG